MIRKLSMFLLVLLFVCTFGFSQFRVGGPWTPISFQDSWFHAGGSGGGWNLGTTGPETYQYKDLGDTILLDIQANGGTVDANYVPDGAAALVIVFPSTLPVPVGVYKTGLCAIKTGPNGTRAFAQYELYNDHSLVIWPIQGMFPGDLFPVGTIEVHIQLEYSY